MSSFRGVANNAISIMYLTTTKGTKIKSRLFLGGPGWTELAKPPLSYVGPGFHSCLVPTPATHIRSLFHKVLFRNAGTVIERGAINDSNSRDGPYGVFSSGR